MTVYTVHAPLTADTRRPQPERVVFIRDGFHFWAAVFGPLWFLVHRLWLGLLIYLVCVIALGAALVLLHVDQESRVIIGLLVAILTGFEAASLQRWSYSRGKWQLLDVVVEKTRDAAEHRFFDRWAKAGAAGAVPTVDRGGPPPVRPSPPPPGPFGEVMGLFPEPRTPR
jgi:hypothetical protein